MPGIVIPKIETKKFKNRFILQTYFLLFCGKISGISCFRTSKGSSTVSNHPSIESWTNPFSTPVLSAQSFAQTKFGSLKIKHPLPRNKLK
jgi:hypothetical protein